MGVQIHKLNPDFFERSMTEKMPFYSGKSLVRVIISLFDETQLLPLRLVKSRLHTVRFFESLETKDKDLSVILVIKRREGDVHELTSLKPVNGSCENCDCLFRSHIWAISEIAKLSLLFSLQEESGESA
jgi:hypothetical protein